MTRLRYASRPEMVERPAFKPSAALAAYAERLASGHRVVVFGDTTSGLAELLLERGARLVHVYDTDAARAAETANRNRSHNLWFAPLADGDLALRERAFDLVIVENVASYGTEAQSLLRRIRRTLSPRGAALIACPNPEVRLRLLPEGGAERVGLDYYALYDIVVAQFPHVRMLGQMPFVAYAIADFATEGAPEPTLDAGFLAKGAEEPEWFVALAGEHAIRLDEFQIVQLPFRIALGRAPGFALEHKLSSAQSAERRARERLAVLEAENGRLSEALRLRPGAGAGGAEIEALRRELERREAWIAQLEARAATADARADDTQSELDDEREHNATLRKLLDTERAHAAALEQRLTGAAPDVAPPPSAELVVGETVTEPTVEGEPEQPSFESARLVELEAEIARREAHIAELDATLASRDGRLSVLDRMVAELRERIAELTRGDDDRAAQEISALESLLVERGTEIQRLERELAEAERIGRELVRELASARAAVGQPALSAAAANETIGGDARNELESKLDRLAELNAQREADLVAARWTIEELELKLGTDAASQPARSAAAANETDAARKNTAIQSTSTADPVRAELERRLASAEAALQRQSVLLEQLKAQATRAAPPGIPG